MAFGGGFPAVCSEEEINERGVRRRESCALYISRIQPGADPPPPHIPGIASPTKCHIRILRVSINLIYLRRCRSRNFTARVQAKVQYGDRIDIVVTAVDVLLFFMDAVVAASGKTDQQMVSCVAVVTHPRRLPAADHRKNPVWMPRRPAAWAVFSRALYSHKAKYHRKPWSNQKSDVDWFLLNIPVKPRVRSPIIESPIKRHQLVDRFLSITSLCSSAVLYLTKNVCIVKATYGEVKLHDIVKIFAKLYALYRPQQRQTFNLITVSAV